MTVPRGRWDQPAVEWRDHSDAGKAAEREVELYATGMGSWGKLRETEGN